MSIADGSLTVQLGALAAGLVAFSVVHSVLATASVQRRFERCGMRPRSYRLAYNGVSTILLLALAPILRGDLPVVWQARGPWRLVLLGVQVAALLGFVWTLRGFDVREFLGLHAPASGAGRRLASAPGVQPGSSARLQTGGAYALCRHPLYFFTCRPETPTLW